MTDLTSLRISYTRAALSKQDLAQDPLQQFNAWFAEALAADLPEPYAMSLATVSAEGQPSVRTVLLRRADERGLTFYTNYDSHKGHDLSEQPKAEVLFYWAELERQVRVRGQVQRLSREESRAYFEVRPRESQLAAHVSTPQSAPIESRQALEARFEALRQQYADQPVPLPEFWGGYVLRPQAWEFWQGRPNRMHDRFLYQPAPDTHSQQGQESQLSQSWSIQRLMP